MENFSPDEILLLSKLHKRSTESSTSGEAEKFLLSGLLKISDTRYELGKLSVQKLKDLLRKKQVKIAGKKERLVTELISCLSASEIQALNLQRYYFLTEKGNELLSQNEALILASK